MLTATTVELYDGLVATGLPGQGRLAAEPDPRAVRRHERRTATCSWSAPARPGLAAALTAAAFRRAGGAAGRPARARRVAARHAERHRRPPGPGVGGRRASPSSRPSPRSGSCSAPPPSASTTTASSSRSSGAPTTSASPPRRTCPASGSGGIRARQVVAGHRRARAPARVRRQRPARHHARRDGPHLPAPLRRAVRPPGGGVHHQRQRLRRGRRPGGAGVEVAAVVDARRAGARALGRRCERRGIEVRTGHVRHRHERDVDASPGARRRAGRRPARGAHRHRLRPAAGLGWLEPRRAPLQPGPRPAAYDDAVGAFVPAPTSTAVGVAGAARGGSTLAECLARRCRRRRGRPDRVGLDVPRARTAGPRTRRPARRSPCGRCPTRRAGLRPHAVRRPAARRDGRRHPARHRRRAAVGGARQALHDDRHRARPGQDVGHHRLRHRRRRARRAARPTLGTTTFRPPYTPVSFAALAGRDRGRPARPRAGHAAARLARRAGAVFEDVGQWKRPWFYPRAGRGHGGGRAARVPGGPGRRWR